MQFSDIHIHALFGTDDGAETSERMFAMVDAAYADGARQLCLTPHYHPGYFGENAEKSKKAFEMLLEYVNKKYSDLSIALGNELRYNLGCVAWLADGRCLCINNTKYVLVDFWENESKQAISKGLDCLLNAGYKPILAHAERYVKLNGDIKFLKSQKENGVCIQIDTGSIFGNFGLRARRFCKKILKEQLADFVSSDAHSLKTRPPGIKKAYEHIKKKYGKAYAEAVCYKNAARMIFGN